MSSYRIADINLNSVHEDQLNVLRSDGRILETDNAIADVFFGLRTKWARFRVVRATPICINTELDETDELDECISLERFSGASAGADIRPLADSQQKSP